MFKIFLFLNLITQSFSFTLPPPRHFNHWHCINLEKNIDKSKPYKYKIGDLSLMTYFNDSRPITTLNTLSNITKTDIGKTIIYDDKLWWGLDPQYNTPSIAPYANNNSYATQTLKFILPASVTDSVYSSINMNYANYANYMHLARVMRANMNMKLKQVNNSHDYDKSRYTVSYKLRNISITNIYDAPYCILTHIKLTNNQRLVLYANLLPLERNKTQCIITVRYNKDNPAFNKLLNDMVSFFERNTNKLLEAFNIYMFAKKRFGSYDIDSNLTKILDNYEYPDTEKVIQLYYYISNKKNI